MKLVPYSYATTEYSCKAGCTDCCKIYPVNIYYPEAYLISKSLNLPLSRITDAHGLMAQMAAGCRTRFSQPARGHRIIALFLLAKAVQYMI